MSGVASFSPYLRSRDSQSIGVASPSSATIALPAGLSGAKGSSFRWPPRTTGMTSSSSPTSRRARRVLACPRSPRKTRSWPARIAFSMAGRTVSSKPTIPGKTATPSPSRARRFARSSCLTVRGRQPEARSSPRVIGRMSGCWVSAGTFTRGASVGREAGRWPGLAAYAAVARCVKRRPTGVSRPSTDRRPAGRGRSDGARMQRSWCVLATQTERSGQIVVGTKGTPAGYRCRNC